MVGAAPRTAELRAPSGRLQATFIPGVGMLGWSLRDRGDELVARPVTLADYAATGEPTGIALLHPWANRLAEPEYEVAGRRVRLDTFHPDPHGLPIHGLVAGSPHWELLDERPAGLRARLDYPAHPDLMAGFPFPHVLELSAELGDEQLEVATELTATGNVPVPVAFGFHPYLQLPRLSRAHWWVELPVTSRMELDERMLPTGRSEPVRIPPGPLGDADYDDAFDGLADAPEFVLAGGGRRVAVRFLEGYRFAQVYAPRGRDFISFEPMTAPINPFADDRTRLLAPGASYRARFAIAVG
jgi:aldose 1-epimerase